MTTIHPRTAGPKTIELRPRDIVALIVTTAALAVAATATAFVMTRDMIRDDPASGGVAPSTSASVLDLATVAPDDLAAAYGRPQLDRWSGPRYVAGVEALTAFELAAAHGRPPVRDGSGSGHVAAVTDMTPAELAATYGNTGASVWDGSSFVAGISTTDADGLAAAYGR